MSHPDPSTANPNRSATTADLSLLTRLRFRMFQGESDYAAMVAVQEGRQAWDQIDPLSTREGILTLAGAQRLVNGTVEPTNNMLFVEIDGQIIGHNHIQWWRESNNHNATVFLYLGYVLPAWRNLGIDALMLNWGEYRIRALAEALGVSSPCFYASNASETERETAALLRQHGYTEVQTQVDMVCDDLDHISSAPLFEPLELRPVSREHRRAIMLAENEAYAHTWMADDHSEEAIQQFVEDDQVDTSLWQVAWDGEEIAGCVQIFISLGRAVFDEVWVRPAWRRRGVAKALIACGLQAIKARGIQSARLETNDANPFGARTLYEQLGFRPAKRFGLYRKPLALKPS